MRQHIPGTIGDFGTRKIQTRTSLLTRALENRERMSTQWRGKKKRGGGYAVNVTPFPMFRGSTKQTCGLNPWISGNNVPRIGAPMGIHYDTLENLGCDPLSWHQAGLITNPSLAFMSSPSAGKSTAARVMMRGMTAHGVKHMTIGDIKNEHGEQAEKDGANHVVLSPNGGCLNVLDPGNIQAILDKIDLKLGDTEDARKCRDAVLSDFHNRRAEITQALIAIQRGGELIGYEESVIYSALKEMYETDPARVPVLEDLRGFIKNPPTDGIKELCDWDNDESRYQDRVDKLRLDLAAVCRSGTLGPMFNGPTTVDLRHDQGMVFDISAVRRAAPKILSAAYLVTWIVAFGIIETSHILADYEVHDREQFAAWLEEFWLALSASKGIVDKVNRVGRTNRTDGVAIIYLVHTLNDFKALPDAEDRAKAAGILNKCGMKWFGGLPRPELEKISEEVTKLSKSAMDQLEDWDNPAFSDEDGVIPGRGCFAIVRAGQPIIPVRVLLTETERRQSLHDTDKRLHTV